MAGYFVKLHPFLCLCPFLYIDYIMSVVTRRGLYLMLFPVCISQYIYSKTAIIVLYNIVLLFTSRVLKFMWSTP